MKTLQVHVLKDGSTFNLALFEGLEPSALLSAVSARTGLYRESLYYFTATEDPTGLLTAQEAQDLG